MTRLEQKNDERRVVESLQWMDRSFPRADIEDCREPLDFRVSNGSGGYIGIEVTELGRDRGKGGSTFEERERLMERIAEASGRAYESLGGMNPHVHMHFVDSFSCHDVRGWAECIARVVHTKMQSMTPCTLTDIDGREAGLPRGIQKLQFQGIPELQWPQFSVSTSTPWEYLGPQHIRGVLADKERRIRVYREQCDEVWLVLFIRGGRMNSAFQIPFDLESYSYVTDFDRLILFDYGTRFFPLSTRRTTG